MSTTLQRTAPIREKRSGVIGAFAGTVDVLAREAAAGPLPQRVRTFTQDGPSDLLRALSLLRSVAGLGIVVHGPAGCAAALVPEGPEAPWATTGLDQRDSILGADTKLEATIRALHASRAPRAIAVVTTPVVAINNDDVLSVTFALRDELGIPVFPVFADGFRSKIAATGHDVAVHALASHLLPHRQPAPADGVTLLAVTEGDEDLAGLGALLAEIGLESVSFPRAAALAELGRVASSRLSVAIDPDEAAYAGELLRRVRGVPYLAPPPPVGFAGTARWLSAVGESTDRAAEAATIVARHARRLGATRESIGRHAGARLFVSLPAPLAFAVAELAAELGLALAGLSVPSVGAHHAERLAALAASHPGLPILVGEGQVFEEVNLLAKVRPDLHVARGAAAAHALRLGIPALDLQRVPLLGYAGAERFAGAVARRLAHGGLARFLAGEPDGTYLPGWLAKSTHWFVKQEVK